MSATFPVNALHDALDKLFSEGVDQARTREHTEFERLVGDQADRLVLFGAGTLGRQVLTCLRHDGIEPVAFSDNRPDLWGGTLDGLRVHSPAEAAHAFGASSPFLVSIWNEQHCFRETADQLRDLGCRTVLASPALRWKYRDRIPPFPLLFLDLPTKVHDARSDVMRAAAVWADDQSRHEYLAQVRLRLLGDLYNLPAPIPDPFAPVGLFQPKASDVLVDCGAFDGDTVRSMVQAWDGSFTAIHALEPDPASYQKLVRFIGTLPPALGGRVSAINAAVSERSGTVRFRADGSLAATISEDGDVAIRCVSLDDLFQQERVSYVKMDIEGEEPAALRGALKLVSRCRPILSICAYHALDHLWSIPLFLREHLSDYSVFLRPHNPDGWNLIVYAVPRERVPLVENQ